MRRGLNLHPDSHCSAVTGINVDVARTPAGGLVLSYFVAGRIRDLLMPPVVEPVRADELWRHTCFEVFVRPAATNSYCEFNFAPSMRWSAYLFDGYRSGMRVAGEIAAPKIELRSGPASYSLQAFLELSTLPRDAAWNLALSAVIEEADGNKSYWALAHPPGKPDFHHSDCFALQLSPA
jgi:hypothetical protein